jgi:hypothetical protein
MFHRLTTWSPSGLCRIGINRVDANGVLSRRRRDHTVADIIVRCGHCGRDNKVSEYAADGGVVCAGCDQALNLPTMERGADKLRMRKIATNQGDTLTGRDMSRTEGEENISATTAAAMNKVLDDVHRARTKVKNPFAIWSWLAFFGLGGLLVGAQYLVANGYAEYMQYYQIARLVSVGLVSLLVLIVAFEDGSGQGLLCLFAPLYILYYAFMRVEYYWLRGLFMAVVVAIGTEMYFMKDQAMATIAQTHVNNFIQLVSKQISRASESPDMPPPRKYRRGNTPTGPAQNPNRPGRGPTPKR